MTPEQRVRQSQTKLRILGQRELRAFMRGDLSYLPENGWRRIALDIARRAYEAGRRDGSQ